MSGDQAGRSQSCLCGHERSDHQPLTCLTCVCLAYSNAAEHWASMGRSSTPACPACGEALSPPSTACTDVPACHARWAKMRSSAVGSAWPVRVCCYDGTVWDDMPDDVEHAFVLVKEYDNTCGCERPGEHYVERSRPAVWERVTADDARPTS